jgi:dipeptidyl aminopeptidase/acylaminoacyl peptidase
MGAEGLAWYSDGAAVLFSSTTQGDEIYTVRELSLNGAVRNVLTDHTGIIVLDAAPGGKLLATDYHLRGTLFARFAGAEAERELPWLGESYLPIMSRDGRNVAFSDQSRMAGKHYSVCLQPADGSPPVRLGDGIPVDFSADGASVLAMVPSDPPRLMIYPTGAGVSRDLSDPEFVSYDYNAMRFTADGRGVLFCGTRRGGASRAYLLDLPRARTAPWPLRTERTCLLAPQTGAFFATLSTGAHRHRSLGSSAKM